MVVPFNTEYERLWRKNRKPGMPMDGRMLRHYSQNN